MAGLFDDLPEQLGPVSEVVGAPRLRRASRDQVELRPASLDELIGPEHLARAVWQLVERFDLGPLLARIEAREGTGGHPHTDPMILVSLWLYGTLDGIGSARGLARACLDHAAYRWLCGGVSVNHHTLSDFRVSHAAWLDGELVRGLTVLMTAGVVSVQTVAQDGLRVRASAGGSSFRREKRLRVFARLAHERVAQLKAEVAHDPAVQKTRKQAAEERAARERAARIEAALAAIPDRRACKKRNKGDPDQARVSTTDPEARVMKMPDGGFRPAYNVQLAAEIAHGLVVGVDVTTTGTDQDQLDPMCKRVCEVLGASPANVLVDGGFVSQKAIEAVERRGSRVHAPITRVIAQGTSPAINAYRARMETPEGKALYRLRGRTIEWVNACARNRGLTAFNVRSRAKARAVVLWHALAHNVDRIIRTPVLMAAATA